MRRILAAAALALALIAPAAADPLLQINTGTGPNDRTGDSVRDAFIKTMTAVNSVGGAIDGKAPIASPTFTGTATIPALNLTGSATGDFSGISARLTAANAVLRTLADKLSENLSIKDFYHPELGDGADYLPAFNRAYTACPNTGCTIHVPRAPGCYPVSGPVILGDGSAAAPSTKQNINIVGEGGSGTGVQFGANTDKGVCVEYTGTASIGAVMQFSGPMTMGLHNITLKGGYKGVATQPTINTTSGFNTVSGISSMSNIVVGSYLSAAGIPAGTIVTAVNSGASSVTISNNATATASGVASQFSHNEAYADRGLSLLHVFRSEIKNVGIINTRVGMRQDVYGNAQGVSIGSADNDFTNVWVENPTIAGGTAGTGGFEIGNADVGGGFGFDAARNTYTNLVAVVAGDPNATGLVLRYADNLTFRGGMMYSSNPPGLGYALALLPPTGSGTQYVYPGEITFQGTALIGRIYRDPQWDPSKNGDFGISMWNIHSGDMVNPGIQGHGTLPSFPGFKGTDSRGIMFGWSQWRSWLDDASGASVAYDAPATVSRKTTLTQITGTTSATTYATHKLPANAMRSRNSKDYPNSTYPLSDAGQYAYDRVVRLSQSGNWFDNNSATNVQVQIKLGSTVIYDSGLVGLPASASYGAWRLEGDLTQSASNAQSFSGTLTLGQAGSAQGAGLPAQEIRINNKDTTVDMTSDQTLTAVITPSTSGFVWNAQRSTATVQ